MFSCSGKTNDVTHLLENNTYDWIGLTNEKAYYNRSWSYLNISGSTCFNVPRYMYYDRRPYVNLSTQYRVLQSTVGLDLVTAFNFFAFPYKKKSTCVKKLSEGATACLFHLPLQAFFAVIMKLNARAGIIFRNCEKSNDGNPRKRW